MPINFNIPLPGPFSYSARVTPNIGKTVRQINRATKGVAQEKRCACSRPPALRSAPRPVARREPEFYAPVEASSIPPTPRYVNVLWVLALVNLALLGVALLVI